ncbi:LA2681 family HEPN domain-containing protein [Aeromonas caviae]
MFINDLNGISTSDVVNHDVLELPSFSARINPLLTNPEELSFHGHFDELKTDYCYARYLAFSASSMSLFDEHFFNATFQQVDTLDYEINNLKTNHLKSCFRISYSIFDKISFFLHRFFELDAIQNDPKVDFKQVWFKPQSNKNKLKELKDIFNGSSNDYFKALYFISHEIRQSGGPKASQTDDPSYWFDPDTERMFKIRNAMEHRAFKLVDAIGISRLQQRDIEVVQHENDLLHIQKEIADFERHLQATPSNSAELAVALDKLKSRELALRKDLDEKERLSTYFLALGVEEFESLAMKLLMLAKDALVYLSLAVHHEESMRPQTALTIPSAVPKK